MAFYKMLFKLITEIMQRLPLLYFKALSNNGIELEAQLPLGVCLPKVLCNREWFMCIENMSNDVKMKLSH